MDLEEEVAHILVAVGHPLQPLDFVVDTFGNGRSDPHMEVIQDVVALAEEFQPQFNECRYSGGEGLTEPLPETSLGGFAGTGAVDLKKLFLEQHSPVDRVIQLSELIKNSTLPF